MENSFKEKSIFRKKNVRIFFRVLLVVISILILAVGTVCVYIARTVECEDICDGVVRLPVTTEDSFSIVNKVFKLTMGSYDTQGKCSAAAKVLDNGDMVIGRNMDIQLSNYPIYMGSTDVEGFYPTVFVSVLEDLGPTYDSCVKNGVPKYMAVAAPYIASDSLNSEGLYMEMNVRLNQKDEEGNYEFSVFGTNKNAAVRLSLCELSTYVTMRCKNTEEALELIKTLDIYSQKDDDNRLLSYTIADAEGNYGLLEFAGNEIRWLPGQGIQTNYFVSENLNALQKYRMGIGRYEYLEENIDSVETEEDMLSLMDAVKYSEMYNIDNPVYDIRSEFVGDKDYMTNAWVENDDNWTAWLEEFRPVAEKYNSLRIDKKKDEYCYWISLYTSVVNCTKKRLSLSFYEENEITYILGFD